MDDMISRQAAIDAINRAVTKEAARWSVEELPSAQPEINCSEFPNNSDTISRQDVVSRRRLLSDLKELITAWEKYPVMAEQIKGVEAAIGYVETIPSAQPEIIYCGECKHMMPNGKCRQFADSTIRPSASDFCSAGERKDNG